MFTLVCNNLRLPDSHLIRVIHVDVMSDSCAVLRLLSLFLHSCALSVCSFRLQLSQVFLLRIRGFTLHPRFLTHLTLSGETQRQRDQRSMFQTSGGFTLGSAAARDWVEKNVSPEQRPETKLL